MSDFARETDRQVTEAARGLRRMERIRAEIWDGLDVSTHIATLQDVEDTLAAIQGRPSLPVKAEELGSGVFGGFDGERITVNLRHVAGEMPIEELVDTIVHEGRHAYQQYVVEHPGVVADASVAARWADNFDDYVDAETYGQMRYMTQPVEVDAWSFAERIRRGVYPGS